jgi:N-ethylmaleimide reductase
VFGANRTGLKLSLICDYNDMEDSDPFALMDYLVDELNKRNVAFIEFSEAISFNPETIKVKAAKIWAGRKERSFREIFKPKFRGAWITNYQMEFDSGNEIIAKGEADFCSFGQYYVCNDNLAEKFRKGIKPSGFYHLVTTDPKLFPVYLYGNDQLGYLDLSVYEQK